MQRKGGKVELGWYLSGLDVTRRAQIGRLTRQAWQVLLMLSLAGGCASPMGREPCDDLFLSVQFTKDGDREVEFLVVDSTVVLFEVSSEPLFIRETSEVEDNWKARVHWVRPLSPEACGGLRDAVKSLDWEEVDRWQDGETLESGWAGSEEPSLHFRLRDAQGRFHCCSSKGGIISGLDALVRRINGVLPNEYSIDWRRPEE